MLDPQICYRALQTRDERFDGRIFVGVLSTGIYCRPVCPARPARLDNCRFYPSAAAAAEAGFRPCLRCRPETAPDIGSWRGTSNTVARGMALIADGGLDGEGASVDRLAERLGIGERQLRRLFHRHLGASPVTVAQTRRVLFAKQLIHDTRLPMSEVAIAAGFGSVRRFNETFHELFQRPPSALRSTQKVSLPDGSVATAGVAVRLRYRPPYDWTAMLGHLRARAINGVEHVDGTTYRRTVLHEGRVGTVELSHLRDQASVQASIRIPHLGALLAIVGQLRRMLDLGTDAPSIEAHLAQDDFLAPLIAARPGLRVAGGWDGFEIGARAVLGQQVSLGAGVRLAGQLALLCGPVLPTTHGGHGRLLRAFPTAAQVLGADLRSLSVPTARRRALLSLAEAAIADPDLFQPLDTVEQTVARLDSIPGVGAWTAHYIALRGAHEPDAFPASDLGLLRTAARRHGATLTPAALERLAERWRPWRGYAAQHLWASDAPAHATPKESSPERVHASAS